MAVESARWMAGGRPDYPEHIDAGIKPQSVIERYYFARGPQLVNRIVDISDTIDQKVEANKVIVTQGPGGEAGARFKARLAREGKYLSILGDNDESANRNYIKHLFWILTRKDCAEYHQIKRLARPMTWNGLSGFIILGSGNQKWKNISGQLF